MRFLRKYSSAVLLISIFTFASCTVNKFIRLSPEEWHRLGVQRMEKEKWLKARQAFEQIRDEYPASKYADSAQLLLADTFYNQKKYTSASVEYEWFVERHPSHPDAPYAQYRFATCLSKDVRSPDRDQTATKRAKEAFDRIVALYPSSEYADEAAEESEKLHNILIEHEIYVGRFYHRTNEFRAAIRRFEYAMKSVRDEEQKLEILYYLGDSHYERGEYDKAKEYLKEVTEKYSDDKLANMASETLERIETAIEEREGAEAEDEQGDDKEND